jgi:hypothetical protein
MDGSGGGGGERGGGFLRHYILNEKREPVEVPLLVWARWFEDINNRRVRRSRIRGVVVSTVFNGIDHDFGAVNPPNLFETMTFGRPLRYRMWRCATWDDAVRTHAAAVVIAHRFTRKVGGYKMRGIDRVKRNRRQSNARHDT